MLLRLLTILVFVSVLSEIKSAKILAVFPMPSISHQVVFRPLTQELAKRGHEVTVITPDPAFPKGDGPANLKEIDVHDISYGTWRKFLVGNHKVDGNYMNFSVMRKISTFLIYVMEEQFQCPKIKEFISNRNNKFDLILVEAVMRPVLIYSHIFKAPVIVVSSFGIIYNFDKIMGFYTHPILYPASIRKRIYNLTLFEKIDLLYTYYSLEYADYLTEADENEMLKKNFGSNVPSLSELYNNIDMFFMNIHPIWADSQPVPPSVVYMGGIHDIPKKELPQDLKTYLDSSKHGVIYLSFGTNVLAGMIPPEKVNIIVKVLSKLPYDVLWKWDQDELPGQSDNIKISKWYPQSDLLRHPKIILFITQAGLQSTDEAIAAGVPFVAIPMLGDQRYNAEKYVKHGIGINIPLETLSEVHFTDSIESVIKDARYRQNVLKLREVLRDQPESPLQRAVWWAEYTIRHGGAKHLRPPSANISYARYFEIEVLFIVLFTIITILSTIILTTIFCIKKCKSLLQNKKKVKSH